MPQMIDIHCHILPGLDDGAADLQESLAMGRLAVAGGIGATVATPHVITGLHPHSRETILAAVARLRADFAENGIPLEILPGAEYRLEHDLPQRMSRGELLTINDGGRYLLVELPADQIPEFTQQVFYELQLQGVTPIIAHPERNAGFAQAPDLLQALVSRGALAQLTADSLTGRLGSRAANTARAFLRQGYAHFIASDAHSSRRRAPVLTEALKEAGRLIGMDEAQNLVVENPGLAVRGQYIKSNGINDPRPAGRGAVGFLKRIFRKE